MRKERKAQGDRGMHPLLVFVTIEHSKNIQCCERTRYQHLKAIQRQKGTFFLKRWLPRLGTGWGERVEGGTKAHKNTDIFLLGVTTRGQPVQRAQKR